MLVWECLCIFERRPSFNIESVFSFDGVFGADFSMAIRHGQTDATEHTSKHR